MHTQTYQTSVKRFPSGSLSTQRMRLGIKGYSTEAQQGSIYDGSLSSD